MNHRLHLTQATLATAVLMLQAQPVQAAPAAEPAAKAAPMQVVQLPRVVVARPAAAQPMPVYELPRVEVVMRRIDNGPTRVVQAPAAKLGSAKPV